MIPSGKKRLSVKKPPLVVKALSTVRSEKSLIIEEEALSEISGFSAGGGKKVGKALFVPFIKDGDANKKSNPNLRESLF